MCWYSYWCKWILQLLELLPLWANSADNKLMKLFVFFPQKICYFIQTVQFRAKNWRFMKWKGFHELILLPTKKWTCLFFQVHLNSFPCYGASQSLSLWLTPKYFWHNVMEAWVSSLVTFMHLFMSYTLHCIEFHMRVCFLFLGVNGVRVLGLCHLSSSFWVFPNVIVYGYLPLDILTIGVENLANFWSTLII